MKNIRECANLYQSLLNKTYKISFIISEENNVSDKTLSKLKPTQIEFCFKEDSFYHLLGLHKLNDIAQLDLKTNTNKEIYDKILFDDVFCKTIEESSRFYLLSNRIEHFENIESFSDINECGFIVDFNPDIVAGGTALKKCKYILYKRIKSGTFILSLGKRKNYIYPETLFYEPSFKYIDGQTLFEITDITVQSKR